MSLNIKNERHTNSRRNSPLSQAKSMTGAITVALRERLEREGHQRSTVSRVQDLRAISRRCASLLKDGPSAVERDYYFYGEDGLPS